MSKHESRLIKAMKGWNEGLKPYSSVPKGMFGRVAIIKSGGVTINSNALDVEFTVPFDDNTEANEAEITVYNLSRTTIQGLKYNAEVTIEAGYKDDTGVIFKGFISKITTKVTGVDKITTIKALDDMNLKERDLADISYKAGTKASYILKDLLNRVKLPIAVFKVKRDHTYKDEVKVSGGLMDNVHRYAEVCGISTYINKGKIYARSLSEGDSINFIVNADTGLIGAPTEFEEEVTAEDYVDKIKGYRLKMILQHRMTTASKVNVTAQNMSGQYYIRSGVHTFSPQEATTEIEVV